MLSFPGKPNYVVTLKHQQFGAEGEMNHFSTQSVSIIPWYLYASGKIISEIANGISTIIKLPIHTVAYSKPSIALLGAQESFPCWCCSHGDCCLA